MQKNQPTNTKTGVVWFRQDLRLTDNPALSAALLECDVVIPVFINEQSGNSGLLPENSAASHIWLHHSLQKLSQCLESKGTRLILRQGDSLQTLLQLCQETKATHIYWNRRYDPVSIQTDKEIKHALSQGYTVESFNSHLLYEPWQINKGDGSPYRVFTAFWKQVLRQGLPSQIIPDPEQLPSVNQNLHSLDLTDFQFLPRISWHLGMLEHCQIGEAEAQNQLIQFLESTSQEYKIDRDFPNKPATSRLSAHLHFGEISPRQIVYHAEQYRQSHPNHDLGIQHFLREVGWREFSHHLLFHFPETVSQPLNARFQHFDWVENYSDNLQRWQMGQTGIPIVDAGMRELWQTGWMHNRVRMIVASLLTKNLLIPWQEGEAWFRDTLVDMDIANNVMGWQWVAGSGADAAPYFRIFNPILQSQKFDSNGDYIRQWVSELAGCDKKEIHQPSDQTRKATGYPEQIVDLKTSRERALARFQEIKNLE